MLVQAQSRQAEIAMAVPRLVNVSGEYRPADGGAPVPFEQVTLRVYSQANGGQALWEETQTVAVDTSGFYSVVLGATQRDGIPQSVFSSSEAQWLALSWARDGNVEGKRIRLTSVPYALRAADAETLGGLPPSAYQLASPASRAIANAQVASAVQGTNAAGESTGAATAAAPKDTSAPAPKVVNPGATDYVAKYVNGTDLGMSTIYEINGLVGFNTTTPQDVIHSRFTNTDGTLTGLAVQNLANGANSYSGMLFYDNAGAVAQFQGFNNSTHEYRINNISSGGSTTFMLAGTPVVKMVAPNKTLVNTATAQTGFFTKGVFELVMPTNGDHGIFVRKVQSDLFASAIHARSDVGISAVLIKAIAGVNDNSDYGNASIIAVNNNTNGTALRSYGSGTGLAGDFVGSVAVSGNLAVTGTVSKGGGSFKIDHPLDPENKYLLHSFVESPDMMNVYNGNAILDDQGTATVTMPEWFETLNRDFRYQLTPIGAPANLYVAQEMAGNQFRIAGGSPGTKVSWQVTGIRQDPWANQNRIPVELAKAPSEKGKYLHPKAYNMPESKGIEESRAMSNMIVAPEGRPR
jgi:hypothetical protein